MLDNYRELRLKAEFDNEKEEPYFEEDKSMQVISENAYQITVAAGQTVFVCLHQRDHRIPFVGQNFPYMSIAICLVKKTENEDCSVRYELVDFDEFECWRDLQAKFEIEEAGTYIIVPATTGCALVDSCKGTGGTSTSKPRVAQIVDKNGHLTDLAKLTLS